MRIAVGPRPSYIAALNKIIVQKTNDAERITRDIDELRAEIRGLRAARELAEEYDIPSLALLAPAPAVE